MTNIGGIVEPGFERVREAFAANFEHHGDVGAACAVYVEGRKVVDLWGGIADEATGRPYDESTLQLVFSSTKGATAACANLLLQRGAIEIDEPVAAYWPEFAANGKRDVPVRWLLTHQVGLPYVEPPLTLEEALAWDPMAQALAAQAPIWEPGSAHGYHAVTFGYLVGEVVRRVTGKSLGAFLAEEIVAPLGLEFWIGLPEEQRPRVAPLIDPVLPQPPDDPDARAIFDQLLGPDTMFGRTLMAPDGCFGPPDVWNRPEVWSAEIPAGNGITNASSLARMYAGIIGTVEGGPSEPLLSAEQVKLAATPQTDGVDRVVPYESKIGLGFWATTPMVPLGGVHGFGHTGAGGSVGWADPVHGIGFGYVMNHLLQGDPRAQLLGTAVYESLGLDPSAS